MILDGEYPVDDWGAELAFTLDLVSDQLSVASVMERLGITNRRKAERLRDRIDTLVHKTSLRSDVLTELALSDDELGSLHLPVLVAYGAESDLLARGHRLASLLPDVDYHELPGAGHRVIAEKAADLQVLTTAWLRRHRDRGHGTAGSAGAQVPATAEAPGR